jgi:hypothetical protein
MALLMATGHGCKTAQAERSVKLQTGHLISRVEHGSSLLGAACLALLVACHLMVGCQPQRPCQASLASSRHGSPACFLWGNIHGLHKQNVSAKICCLSFLKEDNHQKTNTSQWQLRNCLLIYIFSCNKYRIIGTLDNHKLPGNLYLTTFL